MPRDRFSSTDHHARTRDIRSVLATLTSCVFQIVILVISSNSFGAGPDDVLQYQIPTPQEIRLLPPYCPYTQSFNNRLPGGPDNPQVKAWYERMGPGFHATHHYCWGLVAYFRSQRAGVSAQNRQALIAFSINEYDYMLQNTPKDFMLLPEIRTRRGQSLVRLGRAPQAVQEFEEAIRLKPDYWPPYAYLSDYYADRGDTTKAREVLELGLKSAPDAQALRRRMADLDQKRPAKTGAK